MTGQKMQPKMKSYSGSQVKSICSVTWLKNRVLPQALIEGSGRGLISLCRVLPLRKLDVGFIGKQDADGSNHHWSHILIPGELKSNSDLDTASKTWLDLGRYVREAFAAQDSRRFVLGFTLCGSIMRLWEFDRAGGIASLPFDINKDGQQFVSVVLGCLWMKDEQLGFDPTIRSSRFIEIVRDGHPERLILDGLMKRAPCVAGRATTCWKAHCEGDESKPPLVIKDSWQYPEQEE